ncbi:unnamed protein product [Phyllotreta striolata]|uniref:Uncharacterized protein n=1 Tax=Phyllotreta striolata TaxID=444603 RepID=A0A9N9XPS6_PHYSR|nr:unnamed protein product [Phyllotreta striolata]
MISWVCIFALVLNSVFGMPSIDVQKFRTDVRDLAKELHKTCVNKANIDEGTVQNVKKGIFQNEDKLKVYLTCVWSESTVLENGKFNTKIFNDFLPSEYKDVSKKVADCFDKFSGEKSIEDRVLKMEKCRYETDPENYIMI